MLQSPGISNLLCSWKPSYEVTIYWLPTFVHWLLFIHKILISFTCFEPQVLNFRRIQLYACSISYCHSLWEFLVACRYTVWVRTDWRGKVVGGCLKTHREWQYDILHAYNCILLKLNTWGSKHVEGINILWINNNQCTKVGNQYTVNSWCTFRKTSSQVMKACRGNASKGELIWRLLFGFQPVFTLGKF